MDLRNGVADAAVEGRNPIGAEWRCSKGAGVNPLIHNSFRRWLADIAVNSGADDPADVIAQSIGLDKFLSAFLHDKIVDSAVVLEALELRAGGVAKLTSGLCKRHDGHVSFGGLSETNQP